MKRIEVADALWAEVPTHLFEDAVDAVEQATCAVCTFPIDIGTSPASMLAFIESEGPISLALAHRDCSDSRVIAATANEHPPRVDRQSRRDALARPSPSPPARSDASLG